MPSVTIVGLQWGDEGKGKVLDAFAGEADVVVRFQGGGNAGHTVVVGDTKHVFHVVPTGILYPGVTCVIGNGCVVDVVALQEEVSALAERGIDLSRLKLSSRAHVVFPYHRELDEARESARSGASRIGTTKRGIGPCYADKASRVGIRVGDLRDPATFSARLRRVLDEKNAILTQLYRRRALEFTPIYERCLEAWEALRPFVVDTSELVNEALEAGRRVLFEGAQGIMLDVDHGTYPYVTSSHASSAGVSAGAGVPPAATGKVIGVSKAYTTRVGSGPFPTELEDEAGDRLREFGREFGATTGRPRRCGWLDLPQLRYAVRTTGADAIVLTKLDALAGFGALRVATAYAVDGERRRVHCPDDPPARIRPIYEELPGLPEGVDYAGAECFEDLPPEAREVVSFVERELGVPVAYVSTGPQRRALIRREPQLFA
ncbi:MAG: adenylosuccinate synthase [Planctomycetota bacterium]|nr:MAG: adenylosuccinate synthase [Planctomycetota bacterium]